MTQGRRRNTQADNENKMGKVGPWGVGSLLVLLLLVLVLALALARMLGKVRKVML